MNKRYTAVLTLCTAAILSCGTTQASTIIGVFSDPVFGGSVADDPTAGQSTYFNNTATAIYTIVNPNNPLLGGTPPQQQFGNFVLWGSGAASEIDFFGAEIPGNPTTPFQLGTFTYTNGTSNLDQLVFGFTISFYDTNVGPASFLGSDQIIITTTQDNTGGSPADDDYINICGQLSNICANSIEAVETSEGGTGVTVNLIGTIVGDPILTITQASLAAGQNGTSNGFIGTDPAIGAIGPEPATWTMFGGALVVGLFVAWRKARTPVP